MSKKIILTGGGSGGPVTPLLALADQLRERGYELAWIGTTTGIEKNMVADKSIPFYPIASGKFRRYASLQNIIDLARVKWGFFQSLFLLKKLRPRLIVTAGSFVSVPVVWAGWLLGIPSLVHQQDIRPGLANRLMAPFAKKITVTFEKSLKDYGKKAVWTGNPIQREFLRHNADKPEPHRVLILGGGTGAESINKIVASTVDELTVFCSVVHVTGKQGVVTPTGKAGYTIYNFLSAQRIAEEMSKAEIVVSRAGLGTLSELAYSGKPTLLIPMPDSHQEENATYFADRGAALLFNQKGLRPGMFVSALRNLTGDETKRAELSRNIRASMKVPGNEAMIALIEHLIS